MISELADLHMNEALTRVGDYRNTQVACPARFGAFVLQFNKGGA
jgi:hypothetical protein